MKKIILVLCSMWMVCVDCFVGYAQGTGAVSDIVGYDKGLYVKTADNQFSAKIGAYIQGLVDGTYVQGEDSSMDTVRVRRARLGLSGHVFDKNIQYVFLYDFAPSALTLGYIQLVHSEHLMLRVGQYWVPFNLEDYNSTAALQMVDVSIVANYFRAPGVFEPGVSIHGKVLKGKLVYDFGAFNGEGVNRLNQNQDMRWAARFQYSILGEYGAQSGTISDTEMSENSNLAIAVAGNYNDTVNTTVVNGLALGEEKQISLTSEVNWKYQGVGFHGAFFHRHNNPDTGGSSKDYGFLVQGGYMFVPKQWEAVARMALLYTEFSNDKQEFAIGFNRFFFGGGHRVKLQADYSLIREKDGVTSGDDLYSHQGRLQFQVQL